MGEAVPNGITCRVSPLLSCGLRGLTKNPCQHIPALLQVSNTAHGNRPDGTGPDDFGGGDFFYKY